MASKEGISSVELDAIQGSGKDGRVTKNDVITFLQNRSNKTVSVPVAENSSATTLPPAPQITANTNAPVSTGFLSNIKEPVVIPQPGDEIIEMDRMRKLIADHMVMSTHVSPHVTSYVEADVTNIVNWRNKVKDVYKKREGQNLTFTPIFIEAIVKAIKDFPMINVSVSGSTIIKRKDINIGMATALPSGNLIVPVIKNADQLNLVGITKQVNSLANNARDNKLKPEDIQGGTYTVTNVGTFGNVMGTPIINQPQVAILALGAIRKVPAVIETPEGDFIGIRHKMFLSHSYDHRVVDGALGGQFVRRVADYLEQFDVNKEI
jgi:2-oxoglutarate dehydrogenase E2 component (dihydrolipoamide succinyltransferase)